jgi:Htaa
MKLEQYPHGVPVLRWGIKRSFISYLSRLPDGSVSADAGASIVSGSYFQFESDGGGSAADAGAPAAVRKFRGQVRLSGHHGMMSLFVADPWLEFTAGGAVLSVEDPQQAPGSGGRLELLRLAVPGGSEDAGAEWTELPAQLAPAAVELFNGQYPAGEEMDPVFLAPAVPGE